MFQSSAALVTAPRNEWRRPGRLETASMCSPTGSRWKPDLRIRPARMLQRRAAVTALRAARPLAQQVARSIGTPADGGCGQRHGGVMLSPLAMDPHPACAGSLHAHIATETGAGGGALKWVFW
jgi:hypothetical protein